MIPLSGIHKSKKPDSDIRLRFYKTAASMVFYGRQSSDEAPLTVHAVYGLGKSYH